MSKLKHTPGPWKVNNKSWLDGHIDINSDNWKSLACVVVEFDGKISKDGYANARLIAAAPEMLEALIECCTNEDWDAELAKKVIKKATGLSLSRIK